MTASFFYNRVWKEVLKPISYYEHRMVDAAINLALICYITQS